MIISHLDVLSTGLFDDSVNNQNRIYKLRCYDIYFDRYLNIWIYEYSTISFEDLLKIVDPKTKKDLCYNLDLFE